MTAATTIGITGFRAIPSGAWVPGLPSLLADSRLRRSALLPIYLASNLGISALAVVRLRLGRARQRLKTNIIEDMP